MLQNHLDIIQTWSTLWQLRIYYPKCSILTIGPHHQTNIFQIDLNQISPVDHVCDLGITIDSKLKFRRHIHTMHYLSSKPPQIIDPQMLPLKKSNKPGQSIQDLRSAPT